MSPASRLRSSLADRTGPSAVAAARVLPRSFLLPLARPVRLALNSAARSPLLMSGDTARPGLDTLARVRPGHRFAIAAVLSALSPFAVAQTILIEDFEGGLNPYHLNLGSPGGDPVDPSGGNPGHWLRSHDSLSAFMPALYFDRISGAPEPFTGNYVELGVTRIELDAISVAADFGMTKRDFSIRLINFGGDPYDPQAHTHVRLVQGIAPEIGEGWKHYAFDIPVHWQNEGLPPGWIGGSWADFDTLPIGVTWQDVLANIDQVQIGWGNPAHFFPLQGVTIGVDNVTIHYGSSEPPNEAAAWLPIDVDFRDDFNAVDFGDALRGLAVGSAGAIRVSEDGGLSWSSADAGVETDLNTAVAVAEGHYFSSAQPLLRSSDFGLTWTTVPGPGQGSIQALHFFDAMNGVAIENNRLLHTPFAGNLWSQVDPLTPPPGLHTLRFPSRLVGYAFGGQYYGPGLSEASLLRSDDGGESWTLLPTAMTAIVSGDFASNEHGLMATDDGAFWQTLDGGQTWTSLIVGWPAGPDPIQVLRSRSSQHWIAGTLAGRILESRDGGQSWLIVHEDALERSITAISAGPGAARAVGTEGLVLYQDRILRAGFESATL